MGKNGTRKAVKSFHWRNLKLIEIDRRLKVKISWTGRGSSGNKRWKEGSRRGNSTSSTSARTLKSTYLIFKAGNVDVFWKCKAWWCLKTFERSLLKNYWANA